jgi:heptosyltransferase II
MPLPDSKPDDLIVTEAAARERLLGMTQRKWRLVRLLELMLRPLLRLVPATRHAENETARPGSILVLEYWSLGDLAIVVPFLKSLRRSFPNARIALLVNAALPNFLEGQGLVDEFFAVRVPWAQHFHRWRKYNPFSHDWISLFSAIKALRRRRFDWAFSGRMDLRDNVILWLTGARRRIAYGLGGGGSLLTDRVAPDLSRPHRADLWLHLLEALGASPDREPERLRLASAELAAAESFLRERGIPQGAFLVGVHPGARSATRRWSRQRFAQVAQRLVQEARAHVLWFSQPGEPSYAPALEHCYAVSLDFRSFLAVLSSCSLFICNDSGPLHLANLLHIPVVAIFGPQRPESFGPRGAYDRVVIRPEFSCRPCFDDCIFDQPYCLRAISTDEVFRTVEVALSSVKTSGSREVRAC